MNVLWCQKRLVGLLCCVWLCVCIAGCPASPPDPPDPPDPPKPIAIKATAGTQVSFDWQDWEKPGRFFDFPFPSQLRVDGKGFPQLKNFPNPEGNGLVNNLLAGLSAENNPFFQAPGFPVVPVAYFRFDGDLSKQDETKPIMPGKDAPILLLNVTPDSPHNGVMIPVIAHVLESGNYVPKTVLSVSPVPGLTLRPGQQYAFVVLRQLKDAKGELLGAPKLLNQLKAGKAPAEAKALDSLYAPLWATLKKKDIKVDDVAAATVFMTRDVVKYMAALSELLLAGSQTPVSDLKLDPNEPDKGDHKDFCEVHGMIEMPIFQRGKAPFDTGGDMAYLGWKEAIKPVSKTKVPFVVSIPKRPMPAKGYPLMMYVHGTSGVFTQAVDRGKRKVSGGPKELGGGPASVVASQGIATAGLAMHVNKDRLPNGSDRAYLNINNLSAYTFTYVQGTFELRFFLRELHKLAINPGVLGDCKGPSLPQGATHYRFAKERVTVLGQSMGASYAAMFGAIEPAVKAIIPTGTGGLWSFFIANSNNPLLRPSLLQRVLESEETLVYHHPILQLLQMSWEAADPAVYAPRVALSPLEGHEPRHVLLPIGRADKFHPEIVMDAVALSYRLQQVGSNVWPGTQERLKAAGLGGLLPYPAKANLKREGFAATTHVVVQYPEDDITKDGHQIAYQRDDTIAQWRCFVTSFMATGTPVVVDPTEPGSDCQ